MTQPSSLAAAGQPDPRQIPEQAGQRLVSILTAGLVVGLLEVTLAISFAALLFAGPLAPFLALGTGFMIAGSVLAGTAMVLFSSLPGTVGGSQSLPVAIMTIAVAGIAATMAGEGSARAIFVTVVAAIALTTLLAGAVFLVFGAFRLGNLGRFLPYPVVGGFLASTGWLLSRGALGLMVELPGSPAAVSPLFAPATLWRWLPGLLLALTMLLLTRRTRHVLALPLTLLVATLLFFAIAWLAGFTPAALSAGGWLLGPFEDQGLWRPPLPTDLALVEWAAILPQAGNLATIVLVSLLALLLNASALELEAQRDVDPNRELRAAGLGNLLGGLAGGMLGFQQLSLTQLNFELHAHRRLTGLIAMLLPALVLLAGGAAVAYIPVMILASLLLFLGFTFLMDWIINAWSTLPRIDYAIVITILLVTVFSSFLTAVFVGLLMAVVMFVVGYSRIDVIRDELTAATYRSRVTRPRAEAQLLQEEGERLPIFRLQGFLFFGTADNLRGRIRRRLEDATRPQPLAVLLDFRRVTGLDSTALMSFTRMAQLTAETGIPLLLTSCSSRVEQQLTQGGLAAGGDAVRFFPDLDNGMAWAEAHLLVTTGYAPGPGPAPIHEQLQSILPEEHDLRTLLWECDRVEVGAGERVIAQGDPADTLFFIESGRLTAQLRRPGRPPLRLQTMGGGHAIGELGFYLNRPRSADVIADEPSVLYRLTRAQLQQLEEDSPQIAAVLHRLLAHLLAEHVTRLTHIVDALEK